MRFHPAAVSSFTLSRVLERDEADDDSDFDNHSVGSGESNERDEKSKGVENYEDSSAFSDVVDSLVIKRY